MVMHYNLLKVLLDRDYDVMINQTLYVSFLKPVLDTGKFNQMVIALLNTMCSRKEVRREKRAKQQRL